MAAKKKKRIKKTCFVVGPIGEAKSEIRILADAVLNDIIRESLNLQSYNYKVERIDSKGGAGDITESIIDMLLTAELVIVDLTGLNRNVMYEMGIRQAWDLPLIPIIDAGQLSGLPFDISGINTVPYFPKIKNKKVSFAGKRDTLSSIRKQLRSIKMGGSKHTVFSKAFSKITEKTTSDIACISLLGALGDIDRSLYNARADFHRTLNTQKQRLLKDFSKNLSGIFETLAGKLHVLGVFARGRPEDPIDGLFQGLLADSQKIIEIGDRIDNVLVNKAPDKIDGNSIDKDFDSAFNQISKIANKIKTNKKPKV